MGKSNLWGMEAIRRAWQDLEHQRERSERSVTGSDSPSTYRYVEDVFPDFVLVSAGSKFLKVPYTVEDDNSLSFGTAVPVVRTYVPLKPAESAEKVSVSLSDGDDAYTDRNGQFVLLTATAEDEEEEVVELSDEEKAAADDISEAVSRLLGMG